MYVSVPTQRGYPPTTHVPTRTYHCVYTYVYMRVPVLPTQAVGLVYAWVLRGGTYAMGALWISCAVPLPCSVTLRLPAVPPHVLRGAVCALLRGGRAASQGPTCPSEAF